MKRALPIVALLIVCAVTLLGRSAWTSHRGENAAVPDPEAVLYGIGVAHHGAIVRLQRAEGTMDPALDEIIAIAEMNDNGRWAIRHATTTAQQELYFTIANSNGGVSVLSPSQIELIPAVPSALVVVRPAQESSDTWRIY